MPNENEVRVSFRWEAAPLDAVKRAAALAGVPYQTWIKMVVWRAAVQELKAAQGSKGGTVSIYSDVERLRRAWPVGCLPLQGLKTIGGYMFVSPDRFVDLTGGPDQEGPLDADDTDFLPLVDPDDWPSWGLLLQDLAHALDWPTLHPESTLIAVWGWERWEDDGVWALIGPVNPTRPGLERTHRTHVFDIDTDDPGEALVRARARLREGRPSVTP